MKHWLLAIACVVLVVTLECVNAADRFGSNPGGKPASDGDALLAKDKESKWKVISGDWKFKGGSLIGSGASEIEYQKDFQPPFTLEFDINVLKGMRPRVKYGRFSFANEGYEKTFGIYPATKGAPLFHYNQQTVYHILLSIRPDAVEFYVDGKLVNKGRGVKNAPDKLRFCGGDSWSKGEVEYKNIFVTRGRVIPSAAVSTPVVPAPTVAPPATVPLPSGSSLATRQAAAAEARYNQYLAAATQQYLADLDAALQAAMRANNLDEAVVIRDATRDIKDGKPVNPQFTSALANTAKSRYENAATSAAQQYIRDLDAAQKSAMDAGNLDEAKAISAVRKQLEGKQK